MLHVSSSYQVRKPTPPTSHSTNPFPIPPTPLTLTPLTLTPVPRYLGKMRSHRKTDCQDGHPWKCRFRGKKPLRDGNQPATVTAHSKVNRRQLAQWFLPYQASLPVRTPLIVQAKPSSGRLSRPPKLSTWRTVLNPSPKQILLTNSLQPPPPRPQDTIIFVSRV